MYRIPCSRASKYARTSSVSFVITSISLVPRHFPAHGFHERLHVLRPVVNLVVNLAVRQQPPVTVGLQRPLADAQLLAHVRTVHPVHLFGRAVTGAKLPHVLREAAEPLFHLLEGLFLDTYYFHCVDTFFVIHRQIYRSLHAYVPKPYRLSSFCSTFVALSRSGR